MKPKSTDDFNRRWIKKRDERAKDFKSYMRGMALAVIIMVIILVVWLVVR